MADDEPIFASFSSESFKPIGTLWFAGFQLFLVVPKNTPAKVCLAIAAIIMIFFWPIHTPACEPLYLLMHCHSAFWFIVLIFDHFLKWKHHILRLNGYLSAYEKMTKYGSLPFFIVSLGMCIMMIEIIVYLQLKMIPFHCAKFEWSSPLIVVLLTTLVELAVLMYIITVYIVQVYRFSKVRPVPDVDILNWEAMPSIVGEEVGFRGRGEVMEGLLQNQADLIRHYRDANEVLNRKVMGLTAQLRGDSIN